jgi:hypothetical protein
MTALSLALTVALAAPLTPGDLDSAASTFAAAHSGSRLVRAASGGLEHASGFAAPRLAAGDEENARAFLVSEGRSFGVVDAADLRRVRLSGAPGADGSAVFQRMVDGLPVFGGQVAVGWRPDGAITVVNGARVLAAEPRGAFRAVAETARAAALAAAPGTPGESSVEQGWLQYEGALHPAFRVQHAALQPFDSFVSYVDGDAGELLYRVSRLRTALHPCPACAAPACICAFRDSPLAPPTADPDGNAPEALPLVDLVSPPSGPQHLDGLRTSIVNCQGADATDNPSLCSAQTTTQTDSFLKNPDPTMRLADDAFAEQSAYFHIDAHSRFLDSLEPGFAGRTAAGGIGKIFGYVNVLQRGAPLDNAAFSPTGGPAGSSGVMIYGQGTLVDLAYDAEIVYHELTHAAVDATAGFEELTDRFGANHDPGSLNEGTADTFAFAHVADALASASPPIDIASASCLSPYFGAEVGKACLRQAANVKTCRGNGPNDGRNPGRDGEVHDDGEIWTGFTWALLEAAHDNGGNGVRQEMASAFFRALEVIGPHPSIPGYAETVRQKIADAVAAGSMPQEGLDFADCTLLQRDIAGCGDDQETGRAVALFSGERTRGILFGVAGQPQGATAGQQYFVDVPCDATALRLQTGDATGHGQLYIRHGKPIEFTAAGLREPQYDWLVTSNQPEVVLATDGCAGCSLCSGSQTAFGAGRWYLLPSGPAADLGGNPNQFTVAASIDVPPGQAAPQRVSYTIGAVLGELNVCAWGRGASPSNPIPPISNAPPALEGCTAPVAPAAVTPPASCTSKPAGSSGCGCGTGTPGGTALVLLGLLAGVPALRREKRPGS